MDRIGAIEKALFDPMKVVFANTAIERKEPAVMIDAPPRFVQAFFRPVITELTRPQYRHVWTLVVGMLLNLRRGNLTHLGPASARSWTPHGPRRFSGLFGLERRRVAQ